MQHSDSIANLAAALVKVQAKLEPVKREHTAKIPTKSGGSYSYSYASLEDVFACSRRILTEHGLAVTQLPCETQSGGDGLRTVLLHESGEFISDVLPLRSQDANMQGLGAAITYARRYGYQSAVGIAAEEDDDAAPTGRAQASQGERSSPAEGEAPCPECGEVLRYVPAGVSKSGGRKGKPYNAFYVCDDKTGGCGWKGHPPKEQAEQASLAGSEPSEDMDHATADYMLEVARLTKGMTKAKQTILRKRAADAVGLTELPGSWEEFPVEARRTVLNVLENPDAK